MGKMTMLKGSVLAAAILVAGISAEAAKKPKAAPADAAGPIQTFEEETAVDEAFAAKLVVDSTAADTAAEGDAASTVSSSTAAIDSALTEGAIPADADQAAFATMAPVPDVSKLPENEIPVLVNAKEPKKASGGQMSRILATLGVLTTLIGAAAFGLKRWMGRGTAARQNTKIKILTQHALGPKKSLAIVQVAGESILIGVTDHNISMLKTLSLLDEEIPEATPRTFDGAMADFDEEDEASYAPPARARGARIADAGDDDFSVQGLSEIRDRVSGRMKNTKEY